MAGAVTWMAGAARQNPPREVTLHGEDHQQMTAHDQSRANQHDGAKAIRVATHEAVDALYARTPWLRRHDALALGVLALSVFGITANALLYVAGYVAAWWVILSSAVLMSLLHELEHDLIHDLFFRGNARLQNVVLASVWLLRPSTISPWVRRTMHLHHHKESGSESDFEERAITLGEPFGVRRLVMMSDGMASVFLRLGTFLGMSKAFALARAPGDRVRQRALRRRIRTSYVPVGQLHFALWHGFLVLQLWALLAHALHVVEPSAVFGARWLALLDTLVVVWLGPNMLRSFCLNFVSSNMHYYGDIDPKNVIQQTQVWTSPWTWPLQAFCFNFAGTHAIHHFVVRDPFFVRQLVARSLYPVLREHGVRFDDYGTFLRNNRWSPRPSPAPSVELAA